MKALFVVLFLISCKPEPATTWIGTPPGVTLVCRRDHDQVGSSHCVGGGRVWLCIDTLSRYVLTCAPYAAPQVEAP